MAAPATPLLTALLKDDAVGVGAELLRACADDVGSLCLVKECVELEEMFGWMDGWMDGWMEG